MIPSNIASGAQRMITKPLTKRTVSNASNANNFQEEMTQNTTSLSSIRKLNGFEQTQNSYNVQRKPGLSQNNSYQQKQQQQLNGAQRLSREQGSEHINSNVSSNNWQLAVMATQESQLQVRGAMERGRNMSIEASKATGIRSENTMGNQYQTNEMNVFPHDYVQVDAEPLWDELPVPEDGYLVLMVAEKPSIAKTIAEALSPSRCRYRKGICQFTPVWEFTSTFFGHRAHFRVTSVTGHVYSADFPPGYQDWKTTDPLLLFEAPTIKRETHPDSQTISHLQREAKDVSFLVLWLDNDKEGENICFEVLDNVKELMRQEEFQQTYRAKFSSLVKQDIWQAFSDLKDGPNLNESLAVEARQQIDLKIGVAFSRFQTGYFRRKYNNLNTKLVTYGPCQTPTLAFCVERNDEINSFLSNPFYRVVPTIYLSDQQSCVINWTDDRTYDPEAAYAIKAEVEQVGQVRVVESTNKEGTKGRPEALHTVHMLKISSSSLGLGPQDTMHVAEKLYLGGYITYPRTESTSYPQNFDFQGVVKALTHVEVISGYATGLLQTGINKPKAGTDAGDHPPITPTQKVPMKDRMQQNEWKLYDFVVRHFLATVSPDAKFSKQNIRFQAGRHEFSLTGTAQICKGFTEILPWVKIYDKFIPNFIEGDVYPLDSVQVTSGKTTPPDHLTESDLISLMEKNGVGTDASMATHINNICERNYVQVIGKARKLVPTELGSALIHGYQAIDPELVSPTLRGGIEQYVDRIAKGLENIDDVLENVLTIFSQKFVYFRNNIQQMDSFFEGKFMTMREANQLNGNMNPGFNNRSQSQNNNNFGGASFSINNGHNTNSRHMRNINNNFNSNENYQQSLGRPANQFKSSQSFQQQDQMEQGALPQRNISNNNTQRAPVNNPPRTSEGSAFSQSIFKKAPQQQYIDSNRFVVDKKCYNSLTLQQRNQSHASQASTGKYAPEGSQGVLKNRLYVQDRSSNIENLDCEAGYPIDNINKENLAILSKKIRKEPLNNNSKIGAGHFAISNSIKRSVTVQRNMVLLLWTETSETIILFIDLK